MRCLRRSKFIRSVVLPLTLVAVLPACYRWREIPGRNLPTKLPNPTRVTLTDGRKIEITAGTVTEDSLLGRRKETPGPVLDTDQNVRLSLDDVQIVEQRKTDGWATAGVIYLGVSAVVGIACAASECLDYDFSN